MSQLQFIALLTPSIGSLVLVVLAWIHSNSRITRLEHTVDALGADMRAELRSDVTGLRGDIAGIRSEMLSLRGEVTLLRDVVYREMVSLHERVAAVEAKRQS